MNVRTFFGLFVLMAACGEPPCPVEHDVPEPQESKHMAGLAEKIASHDFSLDTVYDGATDQFTIRLEDGMEVAAGASLWAATAYSWGDRSVVAWVDAASPTPALWMRVYRSRPGSGSWRPTTAPIFIDEADIGGELSLRAQAQRVVIAYPASEYACRLAAIELDADEPLVRHSEFFFMDLPGLSLNGDEENLQLTWFDQGRELVAPVSFEAGRPMLEREDNWTRDETAQAHHSTTAGQQVAYNGSRL